MNGIFSEQESARGVLPLMAELFLTLSVGVIDFVISSIVIMALIYGLRGFLPLRSNQTLYLSRSIQLVPNGGLTIPQWYRLSVETAFLTTQMVLIHTLGAILIRPLAFVLPSSMGRLGIPRCSIQPPLVQRRLEK